MTTRGRPLWPLKTRQIDFLVSNKFLRFTTLYFKCHKDDDAHCPGMAQWDSTAGRVRQVIVTKVVMMIMVVMVMMLVMMLIVVMMLVMITLRIVANSVMLVGSKRLWSWSPAS